MSERCPFCGSDFGGPLCDDSTNNETMGAYACGSFFRPNMTKGASIFDGIGKANIARSRVCELQSQLTEQRQENAKLRAELQKTLDAGAVWERAYRETEQQNASLREANDEAKALLREVTDKWDVKSWSNYDEQSIRLMRYWFNRAKALLLKESL